MSQKKKNWEKNNFWLKKKFVNMKFEFNDVIRTVEEEEKVHSIFKERNAGILLFEEFCNLYCWNRWIMLFDKTIEIWFLFEFYKKLNKNNLRISQIFLFLFSNLI